MALLNCRTSAPGISSESGSSPMQSQLVFFRLVLSSLSVNFITVTQIISGDWPIFYYIRRLLRSLAVVNDFAGLPRPDKSGLTMTEERRLRITRLFAFIRGKSYNGDVRDLITDALKGHGADYIEIHFEESSDFIGATSIAYRGERLEEISRARNSGGNIRALVQGSWGFVSFNRLDGLRDKVALAVEEARLASRGPLKLFPMEPVVDTVVPQLKKDATAILLAVKKELLDEYNNIILSSPKIQSSRINYRDAGRQRISPILKAAI
jgi:hypothetical protein